DAQTPGRRRGRRPKDHTEASAPLHRRSPTMSTNRPGAQPPTLADPHLEWAATPRGDGVRRDYTADDVIALRGPVREERTLAKRGAEKLWQDIQQNTGTAFAPQEDPQWSAALGALTGNQAVQQVRAGLKAIYLSGWQVAADADLRGTTHPG